jgi:hypothetical protein
MFKSFFSKLSNLTSGQLQSIVDERIVETGGGGKVESVNTQTGVVVLTQDHIGDGNTYKQYSNTEKTKLANIVNITDTQTNILALVPSAYTNKTAYATDTNNTFKSNGTSWECIITPRVANALKRYVSFSGLKTNDGYSPERPMTLQAAHDALNASGVIILAEGTYQNTWNQTPRQTTLLDCTKSNISLVNEADFKNGAKVQLRWRPWAPLTYVLDGDIMGDPEDVASSNTITNLTARSWISTTARMTGPTWNSTEKAFFTENTTVPLIRFNGTLRCQVQGVTIRGKRAVTIENIPSAGVGVHQFAYGGDLNIYLKTAFNGQLLCDDGYVNVESDPALTVGVTTTFLLRNTLYSNIVKPKGTYAISNNNTVIIDSIANIGTFIDITNSRYINILSHANGKLRINACSEIMSVISTAPQQTISGIEYNQLDITNSNFNYVDLITGLNQVGMLYKTGNCPHYLKNNIGIDLVQIQATTNLSKPFSLTGDSFVFPKLNLLNQSTIPTVNDDITKGWDVGGEWTLTNGTKYICYSNAVGVADWKTSDTQLQAVATKTNLETTYLIGFGNTTSYVGKYVTVTNANGLPALSGTISDGRTVTYLIKAGTSGNTTSQLTYKSSVAPIVSGAGLSGDVTSDITNGVLNDFIVLSNTTGKKIKNISKATFTALLGLASTSVAGIVKLSNSYSGIAQDVAVTEKALSDGLATFNNDTIRKMIGGTSGTTLVLTNGGRVYTIRTSAKDALDKIYPGSGRTSSFGIFNQRQAFYEAPQSVIFNDTSVIVNPNGKGVTGITAGSLYTETGKATDVALVGNVGLVLFDNGNLWGWGKNDYGALGLGNTTSYSQPKLIATGVSKIFSHSSNNGDLNGNNSARVVFQKTDGKVYGAGRNNYAQLGLYGNTTDIISSFIELTWIGTNPVNVWNLGSTYGNIIAEFDTGSTVNGVKITKIIGGGYNFYGQLGDGTQYVANAAADITLTWTGSATTTKRIMAIGHNGGWENVANGTTSTGADSTILMWLRETNNPTATPDQIKTAGSNTRGLLGINNTNTSNVFNALTPQTVSVNGSVNLSIKQFALLGANIGVASVLLNDGTLWNWGTNDVGQNGVNIDAGTSVFKPTQAKYQNGSSVSNLMVDSIIYGDAYGGIMSSSNGWKAGTTFVKGTDGNYYASGYNFTGLLGNGNRTNTKLFTRMNIPSGTTFNIFSWITISYGEAVNPIWVDSNGYLWTWGENYYLLDDNIDFYFLDNGSTGSDINILTPMRFEWNLPKA